MYLSVSRIFRPVNMNVPSRLSSSEAFSSKPWLRGSVPSAAAGADSDEYNVATFSPRAFIPHGFEGEPKRQPIWLSLSDDNPNHANVVVVTNGIVVTNGLFERCIDIFDGNNAQATQSARDRYRDYSAIPGCKLTFWKQDANGNWEK